MMNFRKQILFWLMLGWFGVAQAQDIHYSMFDMAPINLNPAYTGAFAGTFRIGGIYRAQWPGLGVSTGNFSGYQTPSAYLDIPFAPIVKNNPIRNWMGVGLSFTSDKVGLGDLSTLGGMLSLAYHMSLSASGNTRLSIGAKGGIVQQRIDASTLQFESGMIQGGQGNYIPVGDNTPADNSASYGDFSAGLLFSHTASKFDMQVGFAANHLTQPKYQFLGNESKLPMGLIGNAIFNIRLGEKFLLRPMAFYQNMARAQELNLQALFGIHLNTTKDFTILFGGGYRVGDAAIGRIGLELKGLRFGFAYDFNASQLSNNGRAQGFEIGISYIAKLYKNVVVKEILFCPRF
jgi:type IX secretion system PorP/SprF family membrane protein